MTGFITEQRYKHSNSNGESILQDTSRADVSHKKTKKESTMTSFLLQGKLA